jgi:subtilisin-like proprotein convertase family protein
MNKTMLAALALALSPFLGKAQNTPPTIAAINNQTVYVDHPALVVLNVGDAETPVPNLQLSLVSSNPTLVPAENVVFHYAPFDGHWYLTVVPTFGLTGAAINTVTVSDGTNSTSTNFAFIVTAPSAGAVRFVNTNAMTIPDVGTATPYPSMINVTGMSGTITNLTLTLSKINHEWIKDVHILVVGPTSQGMVVFSRISRGPVINITATLTDASPNLLPDQFDLWSEQFRPTDLATTNGTFTDNIFPSPAPAGPYGSGALSTSFNGRSANGTWSLYVYDEGAPDHGAMAGGWSLMIATSGGPVHRRRLATLPMQPCHWVHRGCSAFSRLMTQTRRWAA